MDFNIIDDFFRACSFKSKTLKEPRKNTLIKVECKCLDGYNLAPVTHFKYQGTGLLNELKKFKILLKK